MSSRSHWPQTLVGSSFFVLGRGFLRKFWWLNGLRLIFGFKRRIFCPAKGTITTLQKKQFGKMLQKGHES